MQLPEATQVRLQTQLDCLAVILDGASPEALTQKSDKWSAVQNLAHLGRYHEVFLERLQRIRAEDGALLPRYSAETDSAWPDWSDLPLETVRSRLEVLRSRLLAKIRELPDEFATRKAVHTRFGAMNAVQWVEFFLLHEAHHLYKVFQLARHATSQSECSRVFRLVQTYLTASRQRDFRDGTPASLRNF